MGISQQVQSKIVALTNAHWAEHVHDAGFAELVKGKEPGHRIADYVDDRTCALLKVKFDTRYEGDATDASRSAPWATFGFARMGFTTRST